MLDEIKVVVIDDGAADVGVGLQHVEEQRSASHEGFDVGDVGYLGEVGWQRLGQYMYVLTLCAWPFHERLCSDIQSRHLFSKNVFRLQS